MSACWLLARYSRAVPSSPVPPRPSAAHAAAPPAPTYAHRSHPQGLIRDISQMPTQRQLIAQMAGERAVQAGLRAYSHAMQRLLRGRMPVAEDQLSCVPAAARPRAHHRAASPAPSESLTPACLPDPAPRRPAACRRAHATACDAARGAFAELALGDEEDSAEYLRQLLRLLEQWEEVRPTPGRAIHTRCRHHLNASVAQVARRPQFAERVAKRDCASHSIPPSLTMLVRGRQLDTLGWGEQRARSSSADLPSASQSPSSVAASAAHSSASLAFAESALSDAAGLLSLQAEGTDAGTDADAPPHPLPPTAAPPTGAAAASDWSVAPEALTDPPSSATDGDGDITGAALPPDAPVAFPALWETFHAVSKRSPGPLLSALATPVLAATQPHVTRTLTLSGGLLSRLVALNAARSQQACTKVRARRDADQPASAHATTAISYVARGYTGAHVAAAPSDIVNTPPRGGPTSRSLTHTTRSPSACAQRRPHRASRSRCETPLRRRPRRRRPRAWQAMTPARRPQRTRDRLRATRAQSRRRPVPCRSRRAA